MLEIGVQRDGLGADPDAEVDLGAGWVDDLATADDPRAVRLRAGDVGRVQIGLSSGERRKAQPRRQQAAERTQTVDPRLISRLIRNIFRNLFRTFFETYAVLLLGFFSSRNVSRRDFVVVLILFLNLPQGLAQALLHSGDQSSFEKETPA